MKSISLHSKYQSTNEETLTIWRHNSGIGEVRKDNYYDPVKLALATGIQPHMPSPVAHLICELSQLMKDDLLADILPASSFHFTFLPLTPPLFEENQRLPAKVDQLTDIWTGYQTKKIIIRKLRLVALPSQLLLAGIPDEPAVEMRQSFCEKILDSQWKKELLLRHTASPLPAPFWHSTILRYGAAFLPLALRDFFYDRQAINFGDVSGELALVKINYNWTKCYPVRPLIVEPVLKS